VTDALKFLKGIGRPSTTSSILLLDTIRPGMHRRVAYTTQSSLAVLYRLYVCVPFTKSSATPVVWQVHAARSHAFGQLSGDGGI
jgi:hypothetical protein